MVIKASDLRKKVKEVFPSLKSLFGEYVECLDDQYLVPSHTEILGLIETTWKPLAELKWISRIADCDNFAVCHYADLHKARMILARDGLLADKDKLQVSFGIGSGTNPKGRAHTFNILVSSEGVLVVDYGQIKPTKDYKPVSVRF